MADTFHQSPSLSVAILQDGTTVFPSFKAIKYIDFRWGELPHQESIVLHTFKWRKTVSPNFKNRHCRLGILFISKMSSNFCSLVWKTHHEKFQKYFAVHEKVNIYIIYILHWVDNTYMRVCTRVHIVSISMAKLQKHVSPLRYFKITAPILFFRREKSQL